MQQKTLGEMSLLVVAALSFVLAGVAVGFHLGTVRDDADLVREFTVMYGDRWKGYESTSWLGVPALKNPMDMWVFQEIIYETKPDLLIEAGTYKGGSALYFASVLDAIGKGQIITIDIEEHPGRPAHPRVKYLTGSSTAPEIVAQVAAESKSAKRVMVVLDSNHTKSHVSEELRLYAPFVTVGNYLVVEDTVINGHPTFPTFGPGPWEATEEFLQKNRYFRADRSRERLGLTFNPNGWLRRDSD